MVSALLIVLHLAANMVWVGSLLSIGILLSRASTQENEAAKATGLLARDISLKASLPAFLLSFCAAFAKFLEAPSAYLHMHWFHGKLTVILLFLAMHHLLSLKAKKVSRMGSQEAKNSGILSLFLVSLAVLATLFAVLKLPA